MKRWNLLLIPLLVLCTVLACPSAAHATLIDPEATGSITIYSLAVEKMEEGPAPGAGEDEKPEGEPLANIRYTVTRVANEATGLENAQAWTGDGAYSATIATDEYGRAVFGNLALGVYRVHQEESAAVQEAVEDFLVDVPMTNPTGTDRIYNISVYPKYQLLAPPPVHAYITEQGNQFDSADLYGSSLWIITTPLPADIANAQSYRIQSTAHSYLTIQPGSVSAYIESKGGDRTVLTQDEDYSATVAEQQLSVALLEAGLAKLGSMPEIDGAVLRAEYETLLTIPQEALEEALGEEIGIDAQLHYINSLGRPGSSTLAEGKPYVYTGGVGILKTSTGSGAPLEGASFQIYRTKSDALAGTNAIQAPGGAGDWIETTDSQGIAAFSGLAYGGKGIPGSEGAAQYYLVQTQAPAGYNLLRAPVEIKVDATSHMEENAVKIQGRTGFLLPATGGMGTVWFTVAGLLVIGLAIWLFWRTGKKGKKDDSAK